MQALAPGRWRPSVRHCYQGSTPQRPLVLVSRTTRGTSHSAPSCWFHVLLEYLQGEQVQVLDWSRVQVCWSYSNSATTEERVLSAYQKSCAIKGKCMVCVGGCVVWVCGVGVWCGCVYGVVWVGGCVVCRGPRMGPKGTTVSAVAFGI